MEDELNKVYRLNAKYMISEEYYFDGDKQITVTPQDYMDDFRIVPIFDPKYSTRSQKLAKAEASYQFVLQNPLTSQDPEALYLASKAYAEALDMENIDEIIKLPEVPETVRIDDQNLENTYFIMPPDKRPLFDVFPDQDHMRHIQVIDKFIAFLDGSLAMDVPNVAGGDPAISRLIVSMSGDQKKEIIANLLRHRSQHLAFMYGQVNGVMDETGQGATQSQKNTKSELPQKNASQVYMDENQINSVLSEALSSNASQYSQQQPSFDANFVRGEDGLIKSMKVNVTR